MQILIKGKKYGIVGRHEFVVTDKDGNTVQHFIKKNIIVLAGRTEVGKILAGITVNSQGINYCGLGTGSGSIVDTNTQLESEGARKIRGSSQSNDDSFIVAFYFNQTEGNGTWTRYGTFIDGTATANSGTLFTHTDVSLTKNEGEGLTINSQYNLTDETP